MLTIQDLSYQYRDHQVLANVSMHLDQGETVAILGPSGVGKTTLFNLIAGILPIQTGQILLDGSSDIKGKVSYMLQKDMLYPHYTVMENIMLPRIIQGEKRLQAEQYARELLEIFEMDKWAPYYPHTLSGGMRQRVAFMRTAAFGRAYLLLDEAFSALDAITRRSLHEWFMAYRQQMNWSSLLITHDVDEALILANRIYVLRGQPGRLVRVFEREFAVKQIDKDIFLPEFLKAKKALLEDLSSPEI
ncbi:ABC transporter ATP-binding protein [Facklamia sp. 7083-14-GEN3]|uniref:ABC transporter ATP-binding protein n=1 Tax=Facklamia sp. 7083-14-GEN3 TaxID=2973478 RepID=UPI00215D5869|nr:ABC transporter ATP-binding protein [Facklamia sp. 7083-14-GEN3]MCR8969107.1 ABC transporter ATP-binding protein [Facklamia sp. 7083-14-GEN3]